jgi:branched-chain amino acid transport system substrate-binding protein
MIRRRSAALALPLFAASLAAGTAGCSSSVPETMKIGVVVAQSGPFALRGQDLLRGAQLAADELNLGPFKISGKTVKIEVVGFDDKGDVDLSVSGAQQLIQDGAAAIIGPLNTPQAVKMIPAVAESGKPHLFTATAASLHSLGKGNTFRLLANDDLQARAAASLVHDTLRGQHVAVIYESGDYGKGLNTVFTEALAKAGGKVQFAQAVDAKAEVNAELTAKLKAANADVVVLFSREPHLKGLFKGLQEVGHTNVSVVGSNVVRNKNVAAASIPVSALYATATAIDPEEFTSGAKLVADFERRHKERPVWGAHYAYDAVYALADAASRTESVDAAKLVQHLKTQEPRTRVNTQMKFDDSGEQRYASIGVYRADGGVWRMQMRSSVW